MGVTIKQIAEMAGVHRSTVDKVLHHREGVSDAVRERIQKILDECNYQANPIGKALKMQDKKLRIGVILLQVDALSYLKKGILDELSQHAAFHIQIEFREIPYSAVEEQVEFMREFREEGCDGIIMSPVNALEVVQEIRICKEAGIPVITVNSDIKGSDRLCFIGQDGFKAGRVAGRLMGEFLNGRGRVAVFTSDGDNRQSFPFGTREEGFREVVMQSFKDIELLAGIHTQENPDIITKEIKNVCESEEKIDGIFITCGGVKEVGEVLRRYKKQNIRLICFENYPEILELMQEGIVTLTLDSKIVEQGKKAVEVLLDYLIYDKKPYRRHLYSDIQILVKESL